MSIPGCDTPVPATWALFFMDSLSTYLVNLFMHTVLLNSVKSSEPIVLPNVGLEMLCEADRMVGKIVSVYQNQVHLEDIDMICLAEHAGRKQGSLVQNQVLDYSLDWGFPLRELTKPVLILDQSGNVLLWYLLDVVSRPNQMDADLKGAVNISPVWFQQGHHTSMANPEVSALLKEPPEINPARHWLVELGNQLANLSGAIAIMHTDMYVTG
ncbi:hypothetical protein OG21DRAFT_1487977 [Imleria badia]|nr:hypothetical protein OG21DRAFT_1487977 [Imleria badia]